MVRTHQKLAEYQRSCEVRLVVAPVQYLVSQVEADATHRCDAMTRSLSRAQGDAVEEADAV
jgi:hypothetical protein